ncbi:mll8506 [Mesorhizobium japonicum MAFF 303099]|uniref:Mll8506 protein n=1 Tax=Mesorhizobium japonicum (strain LMG 29417 / CECT 9101 / MAFF 303099) TaxID=266835 RepID=Q982T4_RHILO|nr:mll8506 [Mesorhizobium japonicum MAFF 303099]
MALVVDLLVARHIAEFIGKADYVRRDRAIVQLHARITAAAPGAAVAHGPEPARRDIAAVADVDGGCDTTGNGSAAIHYSPPTTFSPPLARAPARILRYSAVPASTLDKARSIRWLSAGVRSPSAKASAPSDISSPMRTTVSACADITLPLTGVASSSAKRRPRAEAMASLRSKRPVSSSSAKIAGSSMSSGLSGLYQRPTTLLE